MEELVLTEFSTKFIEIITKRFNNKRFKTMFSNFKAINARKEKHITEMNYKN